MESPTFESPKIPVNDKNFTPPENLPEHLKDYERLGNLARAGINPEIINIGELTDVMATRSAANDAHINAHLQEAA